MQPLLDPAQAPSTTVRNQEKLGYCTKPAFTFMQKSDITKMFVWYLQSISPLALNNKHDLEFVP